MKQLPIVLASTSKFRAQLLDKLHLNYTTAAPFCKEEQLTDESAKDMAARLSRLKAESLSENFNQHLIIGSDQVCYVNGKILGKPGKKERAIEQLKLASGKVAIFYTGLSLHNSQTQTTEQITTVSQVHFRILTLQEIQRYVELERPYQCAGSFKSEGYGISLFEKIEGDDPNSLIGLPLIALCDMLRKQGYTLP